ncbi:MAG: TIGR02186 family protein [Alphaproteobacteria bacterium]
MSRCCGIARVLAAIGIACLGVGRVAVAQPLVADLSDHLVAITAGFTGTDVLLFGAVEGEGDVAVVIRGPEKNVTIRRKGRLGGIWVNREVLTFTHAPMYYFVASSRPLADLGPSALLQRHGIGLDHLKLEEEEAVNPVELAAFRAGFIRNKQREDLYYKEPGKVAFLTGRLFRTDIYFPANVPTGTYSVEVFLIRQGEVISAQTTPLVVSNVGFGADVYLVAHRFSLLYGVAAIAMALLAGWSASAAFRRA